MSNDFHAIIHAPFSDISGIYQLWISKCQKIAVAEHPIEGEATSIHCHILMLGCSVKQNRLRNLAKSVYDLENHDRILDYYKKEPDNKTRYRVNIDGLIYLYKGDRNRSKAYEGFTEYDVDNAISKWNDYKIRRVTKDIPDDLEKQKALTDWEIVRNMTQEIKTLPCTQVLKQTEHGGMTYENKYTRAQITEIVNKHLNLNKKKTSIHDAQRWIGTLLRNLEGNKEVFWDAVWSKFSMY